MQNQYSHIYSLSFWTLGWENISSRQKVPTVQSTKVQKQYIDLKILLFTILPFSENAIGLKFQVNLSFHITALLFISCRGHYRQCTVYMVASAALKAT